MSHDAYYKPGLMMMTTEVRSISMMVSLSWRSARLGQSLFYSPVNAILPNSRTLDGYPPSVKTGQQLYMMMTTTLTMTFFSVCTPTPTPTPLPTQLIHSTPAESQLSLSIILQPAPSPAGHLSVLREKIPHVAPRGN